MSKPIDRNEEIFEIFEYVKREFQDMGLEPYHYAKTCAYELLELCLINKMNKDQVVALISEFYEDISDIINEREESPL